MEIAGTTLYLKHQGQIHSKNCMGTLMEIHIQDPFLFISPELSAGVLIILLKNFPIFTGAARIHCSIVDDDSLCG